jgi:hypothetical protein
MSTTPNMADPATIAANVIYWQDQQEDAFQARPLAYVQCLLDELKRCGTVPYEELPEALDDILPGFGVEQWTAVVGVYLDA